MKVKDTKNIYKTIGCHHKYQIVVALIYLLLSTFSDATLILITTTTNSPSVIIKNENGTFDSKEIKITKEICESKTYYISNNFNSNMITDLKMECDFFKTSLLYSFFLCGCLLSFIFLLFTRHISKELLLKVMSYIYFFSIFFLLHNSYLFYSIFNCLQGFSQVGIQLLKIIVITEIVCKDKRGFFIFSQFLNSTTTAIYIFLLFNYQINWKVSYFISSISVSILILIQLFFISSNPRFLYLNERYIEAKESYNYIKKINSVTENDCGNESNENNIDNPNQISEFKSQDFIEPNKNGLLDIPYTTKNELSLNDNDNENEISLNFTILRSKFLYKLILLLIYIAVSLQNIFSLIELKEYQDSSTNFSFSVLFYGIILFPFLIGFTLLMNIKSIGRKFTLIIMYVLILSLRASSFFFNLKNIFIYFIIRLLINSSLIPLNTIVTESLDNKERVRDLSFFNLIFKALAILTPFIYDVISYRLYTFITMIISSVAIVSLIFMTDTLGKDLRD